MSEQMDDVNEIIKSTIMDFQPIIVAQPFSWFEEKFKGLFDFKRVSAIYRPKSTLSVEEKSLLELCKDDPWFDLYRSYICGGIYPVSDGYLLHLNENCIVVMSGGDGSSVVTQPKHTVDGSYTFTRPRLEYQSHDLIVTRPISYLSYNDFKNAEAQYHLFAPLLFKRAS